MDFKTLEKEVSFEHNLYCGWWRYNASYSQWLSRDMLEAHYVL